MARVQYGSIITDIKGSIGGITYQKNRAGNIARLRGGTFKSSTPKQTTSQSNHITILSTWQSLSLSDKDLWNAFALANTKINRFGEVKTLSGLNWFESINQTRMCFGLSFLLVPPVYSLPTGPPAYTLVVSNTLISIEFSPPFNPTDTGLKIWTTPPLSRSTNSLRSQYRLTKVTQSNPYGLIDLTADWQTTHKIPYPPSSNTYCYTIGVQVQSCLLSNGICSSGVDSLGNTGLPISGIGFMVVGSTFAVAP